MGAVMGYADRRSVRAGERIEFKVSCDVGANYRAAIVRLHSPQAYPPPLSPAFRVAAMNSAVDGNYPARAQEIPIGSYGLVAADPAFAALGAFTLAATIWPTLPGSGEQILLGTWSPETGTGVALILDAQGQPALVVGHGGGRERSVIALPVRLQAQRWMFLAASVDPASRRVVLVAIPATRHAFDSGEATQRVAALDTQPAHASGSFLIAAALSGADGKRRRTVLHFNGKIERPVLIAGALDVSDLTALAAAGPGRPAHPAALGDWDFAQAIDSDRLVDLSSAHRDGVAVNLPTRAVMGSAWTGERHDWRAVPGEYAAIHFHDDDLADACWDTDFTHTIPREWPSG